MTLNKPCPIPRGMEVRVCVSIKSCQRAEIECVSRRSGSGCLGGTDNMPITKRQTVPTVLQLSGRVSQCSVRGASDWSRKVDKCAPTGGLHQSSFVPLDYLHV